MNGLNFHDKAARVAVAHIGPMNSIKNVIMCFGPFVFLLLLYADCVEFLRITGPVCLAVPIRLLFVLKILENNRKSKTTILWNVPHSVAAANGSQFLSRNCL